MEHETDVQEALVLVPSKLITPILASQQEILSLRTKEASVITELNGNISEADARKIRPQVYLVLEDAEQQAAQPLQDWKQGVL